MRKLTTFLLRRVRGVIGVIGLVLFGVLWWLALMSDVASVTGSLLVNLAASALIIAFTALLIDWLYELRQRILVAKPLEFARHELTSVIFSIGLMLGKPYLGKRLNAITTDWLKIKENTVDHLAVLRKNFISALGDLSKENFPHTSLQMAIDLSRQLREQVVRIDEILRLYGFALDAEQRDNVYMLRNRIVSLCNSLDSFNVDAGMEREPTMQRLVFLGVQGLVETAKTTDAEWGQVKK